MGTSANHSIMELGSLFPCFLESPNQMRPDFVYLLCTPVSYSIRNITNITHMKNMKAWTKRQEYLEDIFFVLCTHHLKREFSRSVDPCLVFSKFSRAACILTGKMDDMPQLIIFVCNCMQQSSLDFPAKYKF